MTATPDPAGGPFPAPIERTIGEVEDVEDVCAVCPSDKFRTDRCIQIAMGCAHAYEAVKSWGACPLDHWP